ncbi:hypothetical protein M422DRAFT_29903 [Sphaerobolus stellatus SS14]|uniref:Uncharacterized protein n=1 Tax=Sphaerobolus stellatus (strain SS14) TaxID=990650 RepID=A0A0C9VRK8_SPHS4|nr:hypothetical protein M422DRAFT_29903 [Sphaerobolus stellatus SS14]
MGNDGGSIPDRRDLVRTKKKAEQADKHNQLIARWFFCALSKRPLQEPIVSCALGKLYNKDAIIEYLLDKSAYGDGEDICGHIRSLKDVKTLKLTPNPSQVPEGADAETHARFICPLTLKEMSGGVPFLYLATCGCVFSQAGLRSIATSSPKDDDEKDICPQCSTKFTRAKDLIALNPDPEEQTRLRNELEARRAVEAASKPKKSKKRKAEEAGAEPAPKRTAADSKAAPYTNHAVATSRVVANALVAEEQKRKALMSDAVKSLYAPKDGTAKKETFMTRGTFTRYA